MKALLDTNIIIHREANKISNQDIGILFKWLDKVKYEKYIHPVTVAEIEKYKDKETVSAFQVKMEHYTLLKFPAPLSQEVISVSTSFDRNQNDINDTILLNDVYNGRVDILVSQDKKIHEKAHALGISDHVYTINSFLEKVYAEYPELVQYTVLSVQQTHFGAIDLNDDFFDSFREDYPGFNRWFNGKANESAYITVNKSNNKILSFLYLKVEDHTEPYYDISPSFRAKKRLKIGTFKVVSNGVRLGERFLKIIFDNAVNNKVDEVYVTIFDKRDEQKRLISLLEEWGFILWGKKGDENVYVRDFTPMFNAQDPKLTYPYVKVTKNTFLVPIYPEYHTELMPDSILHNESKDNFIDDQPHRNAIAKVYISRSIERGIQTGDVIIFYRTGGYYKSVVTTIGIVDSVIYRFIDVHDFIQQCRKRSVFTDEKLKEHWDYNVHSRPFLVNFLYVYSFPNRINLKRLIEIGVIQNVDDAPRGFKKITKAQLELILDETNSNKSFIVN